MSGYNNPMVPTGALWKWTPPVVGEAAQVTGFPPNGQPTKTGLTILDLQNYMLIPMQYGVPPVQVDPGLILQWIRNAEDEIEAVTNIRLCQTFIAAPAAKTNLTKLAANLQTQYNYEQPGIDFDYEEAGYDFFF